MDIKGPEIKLCHFYGQFLLYKIADLTARIYYTLLGVL